MVDTYNRAKIKLMTADFIKNYSNEEWSQFKAHNSHKGIVSVAGWAEAKGSHGSTNRALYDMPTM